MPNQKGARWAPFFVYLLLKMIKRELSIAAVSRLLQFAFGQLLFHTLGVKL